MNETMTATTSITDQLKAQYGGYATGSHDIICEKCSKPMTVKVSGIKKEYPFKAWREYRGTCRHCRTMFSGALWLHR